MLKTVMICAAAAGLMTGCASYDAYDDGRPGPAYGDHGSGYGPPRYDGCSDNAALGTVLGAVGGGVIGNQFGSGSGKAAATLGGVILGGIAGNAIARDACRDERADAYYYNRAYADAFDEPSYGRRYEWRNPHNGNYGYVAPLRGAEGYRYGYRDECREFRQTVFIDGHRYEDVGVACRISDGSWRIVSR